MEKRGSSLASVTVTLSESALRLLNDVDEGRLLGAAARIRCRERFSINTVSSEYLELYQDVASGT